MPTHQVRPAGEPLWCPEGCPQDTEAATDGAPKWCPWLYASGSRLQGVVADVIRQTLNAERVIPQFQRTRARRSPDLLTFQATVEALTAHVAYEHLRGAGPVRLSLRNEVLRKSNRYISPLQSTQLPKVIALLATPELAFLKVDKGTAPTSFSVGRQTRISAGPRLVRRLDGVTLDDIGRRPGEELVLLKGSRDERTGIAELVDYTDNTFTEQYRAEVRKLNAFLAGADLRYVGESPLVDERDRHLTRRFTRESFGCGGRLFGGFWQSLKKADRLANVLINSEPVVSVDFRSMVLRIAYAYARKPAPEGDLYEITFTSTSGSPVVLPRSIVKKIVAARLNGAQEWPAELREYRRGLPWRSVVASLKQAHAPIAEMFERDLGQTFAFTESEVLVDALLSLAADGVVALPVHDCIVVAESDAAAAEHAMLASFQYHTKQPGPVDIERAAGKAHFSTTEEMTDEDIHRD